MLLAEPPGFRPQHFEYAVKAGKHVFMEKPVATDAAGVRRVLAAAEEAKKKNLKVGVGLQRRHQPSYLEAIERIHDGEIGDLIALRCYWNGGAPGKTPVPARRPFRAGIPGPQLVLLLLALRRPHLRAARPQPRRLQLDQAGAIPVEAQGMGGRQVRTGKEFGNIFDHHAVEFTYADGTKMFSQCRQIPGCASSVAESAHGTRGLRESQCDARRAVRRWQEQVARDPAAKGYENNAYQAEHDALFDAIRNDKPYNEAEYGATSTMTAILGRMATYSGQIVKWDEAMQSTESMTVDAEEWDAAAPVQPDADGRYAIAIPGVTKVV